MAQLAEALLATTFSLSQNPASLPSRHQTVSLPPEKKK